MMADAAVSVGRGRRRRGDPDDRLVRDRPAGQPGHRRGDPDRDLGPAEGLRQSGLDAAPRGVEVAEVRAAFLALPGVSAVHDLHVWGLSTTETALTAHLVHDQPDAAALLAEAQAVARSRFGIGHTTLQLETGALADCPTC